MKTVTSGNYNGKLYMISYVDSYYELSIYDRNQDRFIPINNQFATLEEAEQFLKDSY